MKNSYFTRHLMSAILFFFCAFAAQAADDLMTKQIAINVAEAGTLASKVGSADKYKITSLRLTGCLNAEDMKFIREMAGCCYDESGSRYGGHLRHLDMADAKFVGEGSFELYHPDPNNKGRFYKETGVIEESRVGRFQFAFLDSLQTVVLPKNTTDLREIEGIRAQTALYRNHHAGSVRVGRGGGTDRPRSADSGGCLAGFKRRPSGPLSMAIV